MWLPSDHQKRKVLAAQSCLTLCNPMNCSLPNCSPLSMEFSRQNTGVGCHSLLQSIFPTQGSNLGLLHFRQVLYHWPDKWTKMSIWVHKSNRSTASSSLLWWHVGDSRWKERRRGDRGSAWVLSSPLKGKWPPVIQQEPPLGIEQQYELQDWLACGEQGPMKAPPATCLPPHQWSGPGPPIYFGFNPSYHFAFPHQTYLMQSYKF